MTTSWITTGLPYANGTLHAGHLYEWLLADTYTRLSSYLHSPVAWVCGDDVHGVAVSQFGLDVLRLDWVGQSRGTAADLSLDLARLAEQSPLLARRLGNTYRRLFGLLPTHAPAPLSDPLWQEHAARIRATATRALASGDFASWKEACFEGLDALNERITREKWWEAGQEANRAQGWAFLLAVIQALHPLLPASTAVVADKLERGDPLALDDLFFGRPVARD